MLISDSLFIVTAKFQSIVVCFSHPSPSIPKCHAMYCIGPLCNLGWGAYSQKWQLAARSKNAVFIIEGHTGEGIRVAPVADM